MSNPITIRIYDYVGGPFAVSVNDGQRVHDEINAFLQDGKPVVLSFFGIKTIIAAFLYAAVGQLHNEFSETQMSSRLSFQDIQPDDRALLDRVIRNSKEYYANPKAFEDAWRVVIEDEAAPCLGHAQPLRCQNEVTEGANHV